MLKKKICPIFQKLLKFLPPKYCHQALKNMGLGSGIRISKRHRIPDPDPQHWLQYYLYLLCGLVISPQAQVVMLVTLSQIHPLHKHGQ
jgi:hypothetical protein